MKLIKIIISSLGVAVLSSLFISCERETPNVGALDPLTNTATMQVFSATLKAARNYVYVDAVPVSGASFPYQGVFPGTAYGFKVAAGSHSFLIKDTALATTQTPITFTQTVEAGKSYTIFTYDTITSVKQKTVLNDIVVPADTTARLRFANFIYNPTAVPNVDVYSYRRIPTPVVYIAGAPVLTGATPVFSNVATTTVTNFIPYAAQTSDTLYVYPTGATTGMIVKQLVPGLVHTRSYTAVYNGDYRVAGKAITTIATY